METDNAKRYLVVWNLCELDVRSVVDCHVSVPIILHAQRAPPRLVQYERIQTLSAALKTNTGPRDNIHRSFGVHYGLFRTEQQQTSLSTKGHTQDEENRAEIRMQMSLAKPLRDKPLSLAEPLRDKPQSQSLHKWHKTRVRVS